MVMCVFAEEADQQLWQTPLWRFLSLRTSFTVYTGRRVAIWLAWDRLDVSIICCLHILCLLLSRQVWLVIVLRCLRIDDLCVFGLIWLDIGGKSECVWATSREKRWESSHLRYSWPDPSSSEPASCIHPLWFMMRYIIKDTNMMKKKKKKKAMCWIRCFCWLTYKMCIVLKKCSRYRWRGTLSIRLFRGLPLLNEFLTHAHQSSQF